MKGSIKNMEKYNEEYIQLLKEFSYPNINHLKSQDYAKEFEGDKRLFLLYWLLKELNILVPYSDDVQSKAADHFIMDYATTLECCGFCNKIEKIDFVKGTLNAKQQKIIFGRIFHMLLTMKRAKENNAKPSATEDVTQLAENFIHNPTEGLKEYLNTSRNLFPLQGPIIKYSKDKRQQTIKSCLSKVEEYSNELNDLKSLCANEKLTEISEVNDIDVKERIVNIQKTLKKQTEKFLMETSSTIKYTPAQNRADYLTDDLKQSIVTSHKLLEGLSEFTDSSKTGENHLQKLDSEIPKNCEYKSSEIMAEVKNCSKIIYDLDDTF